MEKKKILIIDDEVNMRHAIARLLNTERRYDIQEASDGFEAEKKIKEFSPHLIILDIRMPGMHGYEVCLKIRGNPALADVKIVGISGISGKIGEAMMSVLGADCFFEKPFDNDKFKNKIAALL